MNWQPPLPLTDPDDEPLHVCAFNVEWLPIVMGAVRAYVEPEPFDEGSQTLEDTYGKSSDLLKRIATPMSSGVSGSSPVLDTTVFVTGGSAPAQTSRAESVVVKTYGGGVDGLSEFEVDLGNWYQQATGLQITGEIVFPFGASGYVGLEPRGTYSDTFWQQAYFQYDNGAWGHYGKQTGLWPRFHGASDTQYIQWQSPNYWHRQRIAYWADRYQYDVPNTDMRFAVKFFGFAEMPSDRHLLRFYSTDGNALFRDGTRLDFWVY